MSIFERVSEDIAFPWVLLDDLRCPYCGSRLEIGIEVQTSQKGLRDGVLRCDCYEYPVVSGIAVLRQMSPVSSAKNEAVGQLKRKNPHEALLWLMANGSASGVPPLGKSSHRKIKKYRFLQRLSSRSKTPVLSDSRGFVHLHDGFENALRNSRPKGYADYLYHRFSNPSFLGAIPPLVILCEVWRKKKHARVLDLLCGVGHTAAIANFLCEGLEIVAADSDFMNLYLLRNFMVPRTAALCIDAEVNLPFADSSLDGLFCLDGLHYIRSKVALLHEVDRVLNEDGIWFFAHMHNFDGNNENPGTPLSAAGYAKRFDFGQQRLLSEVEILKQFKANGSLDLREQADINSIASGDALTLIGARTGSLWKRHSRIEDALCCSPEMLSFNPLYRIEKVADGFVLAAGWPSDILQQECNRHFPVLPERFKIPSRVLAEIIALKAGGLISDSVRELLRSFILINIPACYPRQDFQ